MLELTQHTIVHGDDFAEPFQRLRRIVDAVPVVRLRYATTAESLDLLAELVELWSP
jgi:hypothetical protein